MEFLDERPSTVQGLSQNCGSHDSLIFKLVPTQPSAIHQNYQCPYQFLASWFLHQVSCFSRYSSVSLDFEWHLPCNFNSLMSTGEVVGFQCIQLFKIIIINDGDSDFRALYMLELKSKDVCG